jgi:hypothetical protein
MMVANKNIQDKQFIYHQKTNAQDCANILKGHLNIKLN